MSRKRIYNSKVLNIRVSNKDLASAILFSELLKGEKETSLSSPLVLLISSSLKLLRENKKIPSLSEGQSLEVIEDFLKRNGRTSIGHEEVLEKATKVVEKIGTLFSPSSIEPEDIKREVEVFKEKEKEKEVEREERKESEVEREYEALINESVEEIKAEEELELLSKIFMPIKK